MVKLILLYNECTDLGLLKPTLGGFGVLQVLRFWSFDTFCPYGLPYGSNWNCRAADATFVKMALGSRIQRATIRFSSFGRGLMLSGFMPYVDRGFAIIFPLSLILCFP